MEENLEGKVTEVMKSGDVVSVLKIVVGMVLIAASYAFITVPLEIINGGVTSTCLILQSLIHVDIAVLNNIATLLLLGLCFVFLGKEYFAKSILGSFLYMILFAYFHSLGMSMYLPKLLALIIASIGVGTGYYFCISANASTVGFDVIALILNKKNKSISIGKAMRVISFVIIFAGSLSYGILSVVYGFLFTYLQTTILDFLLNHKKTEYASSG